MKLNDLVQPITLPKQGEKQTGQAVLSGWGSVSKTSKPSLPNVLQKAVVPILDNNDCYKQLTSGSVIGQKPELYDTQVCSGIAGKEVSACSVSISHIVLNYYSRLSMKLLVEGEYEIGICIENDYN